MIVISAEKDCVAKGGHLFHISNQREQVFILLFINSNKFAHACWTGLHDIITEEHFQWVSGETFEYLIVSSKWISLQVERMVCIFVESPSS